MSFHLRLKPIPGRKRRRVKVRTPLALAVLGLAAAIFLSLRQTTKRARPNQAGQRSATITSKTQLGPGQPRSGSAQGATSHSGQQTESETLARSGTAAHFSSQDGLATNKAKLTASDSVVRSAQNVFEAQLALARLGISPGSIDGAFGSRTRSALVAFQQAQGLSATGVLDAATKSRLLLLEPIYTNYTVATDDLARLRPLAKSWLEKSQQDRLDFESILELVAEKAQSHPHLIRQLNPSVDWTNVLGGTILILPNVESPPVRERAALARIHLEQRTLQVFAERTNLLAHFPCSIAAFAVKRPVGELHVATLALNPNYTFDPENFPESVEARELNRKLVLPPGPNNPVGAVWIGLDKPGYGIHGTPHPEQVGRAESHGCFRLANWNAELFARMVWVGLPVFVEP